MKTYTYYGYAIVRMSAGSANRWYVQTSHHGGTPWGEQDCPQFATLEHARNWIRRDRCASGEAPTVRTKFIRLAENECAIETPDGKRRYFSAPKNGGIIIETTNGGPPHKVGRYLEQVGFALLWLPGSPLLKLIRREWTNRLAAKRRGKENV